MKLTKCLEGITRWLFTGKRLPRRMTLDEILNYNLAAGRLVVGW